MLPRLLTCLTLFLAIGSASAQDHSTHDPASVSQTWQMLDYLATDYSGAVENGEVINAAEYAEMEEFAGTARQQIAALPPVAADTGLIQQADALIALIAAKSPPAQVATQAHTVADGLLKHYPIPTAPTVTPDLARGALLYQQNCVACHGASGAANGPAAATLDPPPVDFTDLERADQRSAMSLYEVITQGVAGTSMAAYAPQFSADDRWAMAYYVGTLAYRLDDSAGAAGWATSTAARTRIADLRDLSQARVSLMSPELEQTQARAIIGYLRAHPEALQLALKGLPLARARLAASTQSYRSGNLREATQLALSAYLDGVEPMEPQLNARDSTLRAALETAMGAYRSALSAASNTAKVEQLAAAADDLLLEAQRRIDEGTSDPTATFVGAFTILVREGLEALLVVVALLAFLRKSGRVEAIKHVHAGWMLALVAGVITWAIAAYAVSISGANREVTEGVASLFAAAVLISVGLWMHQKSVGGRWQAYLKQRMTSAAARRSAWFLFVLAFISVYREVFETILFYVALWAEGQHGWLLAGIACGVLTLAAITWAMLKTSRRLPIGTFFSASSVLIAVLAVVLTGKGIAALQEAGWISVTLAPLPHIDWLGMSSTWESGLAQLSVMLLLLAGFAWNTFRSPRVAVTA